MAAVFARQNGLRNSRFNGVILFRSLFLRQYHATALNNELRSHNGLMLKRFTSGEKCFRRWSSDDPKPPVYNVNLVFSRGPLRWLSNKMKLFLVRSYFDSDFDEEKFLEGAKQVSFSRNNRRNDSEQKHTGKSLYGLNYNSLKEIRLQS